MVVIPEKRPLWAYRNLVLISVLYGSSDVSFRLLFLLPRPPTAISLCLVKTVLGTIAFVPSMVRSCRERTEERYWPIALYLALFSVASGAAIFAGIARTDASRAAFLLQLSVVSTPVLERLVLHRHQPLVIWIGAAIALLGVAFLSHSSSSSLTEVGRRDSIGDAFVVLGAVLWGYYLVITASLPATSDAGRLQSLKYLFAVALYAIWALAQQTSSQSVLAGWENPWAWLLTIYGAWIPGALADVMQQEAQAYVRASEASLLLASEPVWALLLAVPILGESFGPYEIVGGILILGAAALASGVFGSQSDASIGRQEETPIVSIDINGEKDYSSHHLVASSIQPGAKTNSPSPNLV